jgi:uncharacterized protein YndB with AHSA1/START domain
MPESTLVHDTFVIQRHFSKTAAQVYAAFSDPNKKRRWFAEGKSHDVLAFEMDFRVGGAEHAHYRMNDSTPFPGAVLKHQASFLDIVPESRVVMASTMAFGDKTISSSLVAFEILPSDSGTALICTHQAVFFEGADGPQIRRAGMDELLNRLVDFLETQETSRE